MKGRFQFHTFYVFLCFLHFVMLHCVTVMFWKCYILWRWRYVPFSYCDLLLCVTLYIMWCLRFVTLTFCNCYVVWCYVWSQYQVVMASYQTQVWVKQYWCLFWGLNASKKRLSAKNMMVLKLVGWLLTSTSSKIKICVAMRGQIKILIREFQIPDFRFLVNFF